MYVTATQKYKNTTDFVLFAFLFSYTCITSHKISLDSYLEVLFLIDHKYSSQQYNF